jgi:hypothetical protein
MDKQVVRHQFLAILYGWADPVDVDGKKDR